jgi:hypothetical protein
MKSRNRVGKQDMPRKQKNPQKIAEGLAKGLTQMKAVEQAGYSPTTAQKKAYAIVKRPLVQSALTEALERQGVTFDRILKPLIEALDATVVIRTLAGPLETKLPDHRIRLEAHDRLISLYGGTPRASEIPPLPPKELVIIFKREGGTTDSTRPVDVTPKIRIEPRGEGTNPPLPVRITRAD